MIPSITDNQAIANIFTLSCSGFRILVRNAG